ncbi:MAG: hypothetical protein MJB14_09690, partial [Spirochaetes bacterium]|nr:hypothetical protein [Spirochaetota bacterium]
QVNGLEKISFQNNANIEQFYLTEGAKTAVMRTDLNEILFYTRSAQKFYQKTPPKLHEGENDQPAVKGEYLSFGEYDNGDYHAYLVLKNSTSAEVIMENKQTGDFFRNELDFLNSGIANPVHSVGFNNNQFVFLYTAGGQYYVTTGQIFFDKLYANSPDVYTSSAAIGGNYHLFITNSSHIYTGIGKGLENEQLFHIYHKFGETGTANFNYVNDDIDGITGFEFEVEPVWLETAGIEAGFSICTKGTGKSAHDDPVDFSLTKMSLMDFIDQSTDSQYTISTYYDAGNDRQIIHIEFSELQENKKNNGEFKYLNFDFTLHESGNVSPKIYNLTVYKKVKAKICKPAGSYINLPVQGYIYDRTVKQVLVAHNPIQLGWDGSFFYNYQIDNNQKEIDIIIQCTNGAGASADVSFKVEVIESLNNIFDLEYKTSSHHDFQPLTPDNSTDFSIDTTSDLVELSGKFYGLAGLVSGYEIYDVNDGEIGRLLKSGLFDTSTDTNIDLSFLGNGYEGKQFTGQQIELVPGRQRLVVYCENPGGVRKEYTVSGMYPDFNYNMSEDQQEIIFYDNDASDDSIMDAPEGTEYNGISIAKFLKVFAYESSEAPYEFTREYDISGEVKSLYTFSDLIVKSYTPGLVFENGQNEMIIEVDSSNKFQFKVKAVLENDEYSKDFYVAVIPTIPFLTDLKKGLKITAIKAFENTNFIPDFSPMGPDTWTPEQMVKPDIPIKLTFNRNDLPTAGKVIATLITNYDSANTLTGELDRIDNTYFQLEKDGEIVYLPSEIIKKGTNRIYWKLQYEDPEQNNTVTMSYSHSGKPGMHDYLFDYHYAGENDPTVITFSQNLTDQYYSDADLPTMTITKDKTTAIEVVLNNQNIWQDQGDGEITELTDFDFTSTSAIKEGKNQLVITVGEHLQDTYEKQYTFMYDKLSPVVAIESFHPDNDYNKLVSLTANVTEANFARGYLHYGTSIINQTPELIIKGDQQYQLVWDNLEVFNIVPSSTHKVKVEAVDLAEKNAFSEEKEGFGDIDRPEEVTIQEQKIDLPVYDGTPRLDNEANYGIKPFSSHSKFAPDKFIWRKSIKQDVVNSGNYLKNTSPYKDPIFWSKCDNQDITQTELGDAVVIYQHDFGLTSDLSKAKYNNAIYSTDNNQSTFHFEIQNSKSDKGTISFWAYTTTDGNSYNYGSVSVRF